MTGGEIISQMGKDIGGVAVSPLILGDSAFPFKPWLTKPFTSAVLNPCKVTLIIAIAAPLTQSVERRALTREVVSSTLAGPSLRVLK